MIDSWFVYILECSDKTLYCGITTDLERRLCEHNKGSKGSKYVRARRPAKIVYSERSENRSTAQSREYKIKKMKRYEKLELIRKVVLE